MSELEKNFHKFKDITREEFFIAEEIKKHINIRDSDTILDIGCADGNLSRSLTGNSTNITFLDVNEFDFSPQEKFIHSSFEEAEIYEKYDIILSSHVWGHFYRNNSFDFCFKKALDLLKENGKLIVVHNSNKDFIGSLIDLSKTIFKEVEFDVFLDKFLENVNYSEYYFDVSLKASNYRELAELIQVLLIVPDELYYEKIEEIIEFLENNLAKPEFLINQRLLVIEKATSNEIA
jgi:cyclopropane fatty-acyl-phospholipid synthase-like methyltransferase